MQNLTLFIAITAAAVVLQAVVLLAIFLSLRKTSSRVEALAGQVESRALPALDAARSLVEGSRDKVTAVVSDLATTSSMVRGQMERLDATVNDIIDRTRLQVIRTDELVGRTLDRIEEATEAVHHSVLSPVRQLSGIVQGLSVGVEAFFRRGRRRSRDGMGVPQDELFI